MEGVRRHTILDTYLYRCETTRTGSVRFPDVACLPEFCNFFNFRGVSASAVCTMGCCKAEFESPEIGREGAGAASVFSLRSAESAEVVRCRLSVEAGRFLLRRWSVHTHNFGVHCHPQARLPALSVIYTNGKMRILSLSLSLPLFRISPSAHVCL